jgi:hypothetical protein
LAVAGHTYLAAHAVCVFEATHSRLVVAGGDSGPDTPDSAAFHTKDDGGEAEVGGVSAEGEEGEEGEDVEGEDEEDEEGEDEDEGEDEGLEGDEAEEDKAEDAVAATRKRKAGRVIDLDDTEGESSDWSESDIQSDEECPFWERPALKEHEREPIPEVDEVLMEFWRR